MGRRHHTRHTAQSATCHFRNVRPRRCQPGPTCQNWQWSYPGDNGIMKIWPAGRWQEISQRDGWAGGEDFWAKKEYRIVGRCCFECCMWNILFDSPFTGAPTSCMILVNMIFENILISYAVYFSKQKSNVIYAQYNVSMSHQMTPFRYHKIILLLDKSITKLQHSICNTFLLRTGNKIL